MARHATAQERLFALRETIAKLEGKTVPAMAAAEQTKAAQHPEKVGKGSRRLSLGVPDVDAALDGGLPLDGMTEIRTDYFRDAGAATGLILALAARLQSDAREKAGTEPCAEPVLWIGDASSVQEAGLPYAVGFTQFGLSPHQFLYARPRKLEEALWIAETALASRALAATVLETKGNPANFGLTESRRLVLRAKAARRPLFLLRHIGEEEASSATFRFRIEQAPASERRLPDGTTLGGSIGHPVFRLILEKSRNPAPLSFILEWNPRDRQFSLAEPSILPVDLAAPAHPVDRLSASADRPDRPAEMGTLVAFDRAS